MIAAIYARKSTNQDGVTDEAKSVTGQIEHATGYAVGKSWSVSTKHIYSDDGISGAEFANRPGFVQLMNSLKPRPTFQVLVMSEESRLWRETIETAYALKQLVQAGVRVFFYLEDRERTLDSPTDKIMLSLTAFADELEREKARQRTYDAMQRKARAGHVTGGRVFGYDNVRLETGAVVRRVNDGEAGVVRRIFELCAEGYGQTRIAKLLNEEGTLSPRAQQGRPRGWAPSSIHEVLHRELYRGQVVWNRTRKRDRWGRTKQSPRPEAEWLRLDVPDLRIVPEPVWVAVRRRHETAREKYLRATNGKLWGRPRDIDSQYLLPGFGRCGWCGGGLYVRSRSHGQKRGFFYGCLAYHKRGRTICANHVEAPLGLLDQAVLDAIGGRVLRVDVVEEVVALTLARLNPETTEREIGTARRELHTIDTELGA